MADDSGTSSDELTLAPTAVVKSPRRRALWGVLAAVAVAAGALAVTAGGDDGRLPTLPVALGATGRDNAAGAMAPEAADAMMMAWVTYVAGEGLPSLGGDAPAYRLSGTVDEARVRALADVLGVAGEAVHEDGYWHLQTDDAVLEVYEGGGGSWWFSIQQYEVQPAEGEGGGTPGCEPGPAVDCGVTAPSPTLTDPPVAGDGPATTTAPRDATASGSCTTYEAKDGSTVEECVSTDEPCPPDADCPMPLPAPIEPQPPADLPSEGEAREIALDLLRATGMDVEDATVTVDGPYDAWYVTVEPKLDGVPVSGWMSSVSVGSKGAITSASGTLATPEELGAYPLIDTRAAIDRLNEQQQSYGYDDVRPLGAPGTASSEGEAAEAESSPAVEAAPTTVVECAIQPDGSERCSSPVEGTVVPIDPAVVDCLGAAEAEAGSSGTTGGDTSAADCGPAGCYDAPTVPPAAGDEPATTIPECGPYPEPEPVEIVLHDAERVLVLLSSLDGTADSYLLPGYRFTGDDGAIAEIAAVADENLAPTTTVPDTTVPETTVPEPDTTLPAPDPDEIDPNDPELAHLAEGEQPQVGVPYYVDVHVMTGHCSWISVEVADRWYWAELSNEELSGWSTPTEGGSFTLIDEATAEFVGDADRTKVAKLAQFGDGTEPPLCA